MAVQPEIPGLFRKYEVRHGVTGDVLDDCFVLRPTKDPAAREAVAAYAVQVRDTNPELAADLYTWLGTIYGNLARGSADFPMPASVAQVRKAYEMELTVPLGLPLHPPGHASVMPCRSDKCNAPVFFAYLRKKDGTVSSKPTPVDWPPAEGRGHLAVLYGSLLQLLDPRAGEGVWLYDDKPVVRQVTDEEKEWAQANGVVLYTGHFGWCPDAERFRNAP